MDCVIGVLCQLVWILLSVWTRQAKFQDVNQACEWTMCSGGFRKTQLNCNESLIFVENVSTYWGAPDKVAFRNIRQMCLGAKSCDISRMCQGTLNQFSRIRYVCVNASSIENRCDWPGNLIWRQRGHIQSPSYPAAVASRTCSWRISAPEDRFVHLSVHDVSSNPVTTSCDSGLNISFQDCSSGTWMSRMFCGNDLLDTELLGCGSIGIQLEGGRRFGRVRFWLTYDVTSSPEAAVEPPLSKFAEKCYLGRAAQSSVLTARLSQLPVLRQLDAPLIMTSSTSDPGGQYYTTYSGSVEEMEAESSGLDTKVTVIIIVSVIGGVLIVAIVLAIIIFKRPKVERIEHVYAVPTTTQDSKSAELTYYSPTNPSDLLPGNNYNKSPYVERAFATVTERPVLRDGYSDVADSITQKRLRSPTSPGYAEVEDVCSDDHCHWHQKKFAFVGQKSPKPPHSLALAGLSRPRETTPSNSSDSYGNNKMAEKDEYESIMLQSSEHGPGLFHMGHTHSGSPVCVTRRGWEKDPVLSGRDQGMEFRHPPPPKDVSRMGVSVLPTSASPRETHSHFYENAVKVKAQTPTTPRETRDMTYQNQTSIR
ncbi:uncharacterized protein LOC121382277 [Gigantopelta aegis]|uniref:uncharacterized protein LOC121382277 n=1 Tax=Gigantopelta aegis TaxID=1735272 RepID=UPI001B88A938|nr:uncharacterized protein LOC121382277 [Gigantopelta aegis]